MQVFFDITSGDESAGRVVIGLYAGEPFCILITEHAISHMPV